MTDGFLKALQFIQQIFYYILDWSWSLVIPGTNIPLWVCWVTGWIIGIFLMMLNSSPNIKLSQTSIKKPKVGKFSTKNKNNNNKKGNKK